MNLFPYNYHLQFADFIDLTAMNFSEDWKSPPIAFMHSECNAKSNKKTTNTCPPVYIERGVY